MDSSAYVLLPGCSEVIPANAGVDLHLAPDNDGVASDTVPRVQRGPARNDQVVAKPRVIPVPGATTTQESVDATTTLPNTARMKRGRVWNTMDLSGGTQRARDDS